MAITATATPTTLSWTDYTPSPIKLVDPNDGTLVDAVTAFNFNMPDLPPRMVGKLFALADPNVITITPIARVFTGVLQTAALLSHEQFHYDIGFVIARSLARDLMHLRAHSFTALVAAERAAAKLHLDTRTGLLQRRYDMDTKHGTSPHYQKIWKDRMAVCLAHAHSDHLGGFWL